MDFLLTSSRAGAPKPLNLTALAVLFWVVLAAVLLLKTAIAPEGPPLSTDDAMRLTEVRDLLNGQSWFDTTQYRMNTPYGLPMHWSRVVDGGVAALILFFRLFADPKNAELAAICVWPLLWLLPVFIAVTRIGVRLGGYVAGVGALLLVINCVSITGYFHPGDIDQHNIHMALTMWGMAFLLDIERSPYAPIGLGIVSALSLAIGLETLPYILLTCTIVAWFWMTKGNAVAVPVRNFGLVFAAAAAVLLLGATATVERLGTACDTYSGLFGTLAVAGGAGLAGLTLASVMGNTLAQRMTGFIVLAGALLAITVVMAPDCLHGPYAHVDPKLDRVWLERIEEVLSPLRTASYEPGTFFATYIYAVAGFLASIAAVFLVERQNRNAAVILAVFSGAALAITTVEARGMPFAILFGLPGLAATVMRLVARYARTTTVAIIATIFALALFSDITWDVVGRDVIEGRVHVVKRTTIRNKAMGCMTQEAVAQLDTLPRGRVAALSDQGPAILAFSQHSAIGGPYHRNAQGILDTYDLFTQRPEIGARILKERGIDYLMACKSSPDYAFYLKEGRKDALLHQLDAGRDPPWLVRLKPLNAKHKVQVFRVLRDRLPD